MFEKLQTGEKSMMIQDSLKPAAIRFTPLFQITLLNQIDNHKHYVKTINFSRSCIYEEQLKEFLLEKLWSYLWGIVRNFISHDSFFKTCRSLLPVYIA